MTLMKKATTNPRRKLRRLRRKTARRNKRKRGVEVHVIEFIEVTGYQRTGDEVDGEVLFRELGLVP